MLIACDHYVHGKVYCVYSMIITLNDVHMYRVEPPIKDTLNKEHLSIKDKSTCPTSYYTSTF